MNDRSRDRATRVGKPGMTTDAKSHKLHKNLMPSRYHLLDINNCIASYGTSDAINHYAKIENGVVTAKLNGDEEYVMHPSYNCYTSPQHAVIRFFTYDP